MGPFFFLVVAQGSPAAAPPSSTPTSGSLALRIGISLSIAFLLLCLGPIA